MHEADSAICSAAHLLAVHSVAEHADLEVGARDGWQLEGARETLVTLWVVVLQGNL
jgi:hypothetical protein